MKGSRFSRADASDGGRVVHESGDDSHIPAPGPRAPLTSRVDPGLAL
jgi:hypothetical protein